MATGRMTEEPIDNFHLTEKDLNEVKEVDLNRGIMEKLAAVSGSISFHSEFLKRLTEIRFTVTNENGAKNVSWISKTSAAEDTTDRQHLDSCSSRENDTEALSGATNTLSPASSLQSPTGIAFSVISTFDNIPAASGSAGNQTTKQAPFLEFRKDDRSYAYTITNTTKWPPKEFNVQYSYEYNMDTMIFHATGELSIAKSINDKVLHMMPNNINALWNKVKLMVAMADESGDCIHDRAEEILKQLEQLASQNGTQMLIAKAEIAAMHTALKVSIDSIIRAIQLYEEVLAELRISNSNGLSDLIPENLIAFWKCSLVEKYSNLTNAKKATLAKYGYSHGKVLSRIELLVRAVDSSPHLDKQLKAQTWVNLANTFEHYRQNNPNERRHRDIYDDVSLADCFAKAREYDPDNPRILMRSGRELRQRANSENDMHTAIRYFEMALKGDDVDSIRDILYHHIGLTYRSLWTYTEHPALDKTTDDAYRFRSNDYLRCRVIKPPDCPFHFDLIPPPYKEPPKNAIWKILNPIARDPRNAYLLKARKCFEEANHFYYDEDLSNSLYLLEIARIYSSTRNMQKAREYLQAAGKLPESEALDEDFIGVSLYENLGLLEETEMLMKKFNEPDAEQVKYFYRESIGFSAVSKTKPIIAFHYLLRILYKQLEMGVEQNLSEMDQMILQNEYFLIYMAIQEAKDSREIVNFVAKDDFKIALMWRLIEMFYRRNLHYDAAAAFNYLSILAVANKLTTEIKDVNLTSIEKQRMLLRAVERVTAQRVTQLRHFPDTYRQLYELQGSDDEENKSYFSSESKPLTDFEEKKLNIVMKIMQPHLEPGYIRRHEQC